MVPLSDPRIAAVPVRECGEPLVDVRTASPLLVDGTYARLRCGVVDRLVAAQSLLPRGVRLLIIEGYRPLATDERPHAVAHASGAAVDLTLCTPDGDRLSPGNLMGDALRAVQLATYPGEPSHWSYGDRYWALLTGAAVARYASMDLL